MVCRKVSLLMLAMIALGALSASAYAKDVTLNFNNADIRALIEFVAGFSGKNFLVDNRVRGKVTVISPSPISEEEAYDVFLSVLEVNGFAAVPSGAVVKIVPRAESKQKSLPVVVRDEGAGSDAMVTQVMRLKYADAQQLVALIRPLISPNSHLVAYPRGNMLLLTDSASNIRRIGRILKLLDRKDAVGVQLFKLKHASAEKLATTLTSLYGGARAKAAGPLDSVKAIAHQPGNMLIVVAAPQIINEVAGVIERLDVSPESDSGRLKVRYLKYANAEDVAKVVNDLVGGQAAAKQGAGKRLFSGEVKVVADKATNAVMVVADPSDIAEVDRIIDRLDIRRRQVLVEALIVEVSADVTQQFGIEWLAAKPIKNGRYSVVGGQNYGTISTLGGALAGNAAGANANLTASVAAALPTGLAVGIAKGSIAAGNLTLGAVMRALESMGDTNVLSTPNLLTMDNEEAEIIVGQNVPFITGQNSTAGGVANPFQTIERKDVGLTLRVKPQISAGESIRLQLYQEISSISPTTQGADLITNKRSIKTVVLAKDQQLIVLGGLMRDDATSNVQRTPCIGAVPIIGEAFKFTDNTHRKTNLMVFLKPHIIKSAADIEAITNRKYEDIESLYEKPTKGGTIIFPRQQKHLPKEMRPSLKLDERGASDPYSAEAGSAG